MEVQCRHNHDIRTCKICSPPPSKTEAPDESKMPHVIVEKRFIYRIPLTRPKGRLNTKEIKAAKAFAQEEYQQWWDRYLKKWGVIGPDGYPEASIPKVDPDDKSNKTAIIGLRAPWIITRRRNQYETFLRNLRAKNLLYRLLVLVKMIEPNVKEEIK